MKDLENSCTNMVLLCNEAFYGSREGFLVIFVSEPNLDGELHDYAKKRPTVKQYFDNTTFVLKL